MNSLIGPSLFVGSTLILWLRRSTTTRSLSLLVTRNQSLSSSLSTTLSSSLSRIDYWEQRDHENSHLEEVLGDQALTWVKEKNSLCLAKFGNPKESPIYRTVLSILESKDKIPSVEKIGDKYYNFWKDELHVRGIWRRTTLESYCSSTPDWETVLDLDELGKQENKSWVYSGHMLLDLNPEIPPSRTLISLSPGGSDAVVIREFDLTTCQFVDPEKENGFFVPEAKSRVSWKSIDTILVGTDFHDNNSLTTSGYPRVVHEWSRGTALETSTRVFEGETTDISTSQSLYCHCGYSFEYRSRGLTFYTAAYSIKCPRTGVWRELSNSPWNLPADVDLNFFRNQILITNRSQWNISPSKTYSPGSLIALDLDEFLDVGLEGTRMTLLFEPTPTCSLDSITLLQSYVILNTLEKIKSRLIYWEFCSLTRQWVNRGAEAQPAIRGISLQADDSDRNNLFWLTISSFLIPSSLYLVNAEDGIEQIQRIQSKTPLKSLPSQFDSSNLVELQYEAISADGTHIPYFILHPKDLQPNSQNKTLLYGYGGFEISLLPSYGAVTGATWLSEGNVYVVANIRGGGEFGPQWHQSALKENRVNAYNDFIAVAEDLIRRQITSPEYLAIRGGSNGGLLMGNMMTMRPDLFQSVICQVPLLDMKRYSKLLAGASWMAEYGNPDIEDDWKYLKRYSAYHNIDPVTAPSQYPNLLMLTSTKDDRVHPYHARSFIARLDSLGCNNDWYYENIEGGHGGAADNQQHAFIISLYTTFLEQTLGKDKKK